MQQQSINPYTPPTRPLDLENISAKMDASKLFTDKSGLYLNEFNLYLAYCNTIPNLIIEREIDCKKANNWFNETYKSEIKDWYYDKRSFYGSKKVEFDDIFYFLFDDLMVNFDTNNSFIKFLFRKTDTSKVDEVINGINKFKKKKERQKPEIQIMINGRFGIDFKTVELLKPKLGIEDNYNDDFKEIHQTIVKRLSMKNDKGLVLLHGKPGTGKSSYIRYLISKIKKNVIFLPPNVASGITNPDLIPILLNNPNSVFVIEDAENIISDREKYGSSPVSALLNVSDGLLSDCLNIQIICTFNTDISKIDSALLRKGRLIAKYEFKELEVHKAVALSNKLGFKINYSSPMPLSAIYNQGEKDFQEIKKDYTIGYKIITNQGQ